VLIQRANVDSDVVGFQATPQNGAVACCDLAQRQDKHIQRLCSINKPGAEVFKV